MGDPPSPNAAAPQARSSMPMLYYGIMVIGTAAVVLALYNLIIVRWCADISDPRARWRASGFTGPASSWRFHHLNIAHSVSSFKYRRDDDDEAHSECAVCLSAFEEGEELRQLPKCKHCFHAPCIDMWLYSHMDCPLCRCAVELPGVQRRPAPAPAREGWLLPVVTV